MTHDEVKHRVLEILRDIDGGERIRPWNYKAVDALDAAGLLVTPAMLEAAEACVGYLAAEHLAPSKCCNAGRAILAEREARKPKPRYTISEQLGRWLVWRGSSLMAYDITEQQARAVAEALNKLEANRG